MHRNRLPILKWLQDYILRFSTKDESAGHQVRCYTLPMRRGSKLEDLKVLRRSPDLLNNVIIGQGQLQL